MSKGPEDSKAWQENEAFVGSVVVVCIRCELEISFWHCDEKGCPWCARCGAKSNPTKKAE